MVKAKSRKSILKGAACLWALSFAASAALAQDATRFDIDAQPLAKALLVFNEQSGLTVAAPRKLVAGKTAPAVHGEMEPEEALEKILSGSGLKSTELPNGAYTITLASAEANGDRSFRVAQVVEEDDLAVKTVSEDDEDDDRKKDEITVTGTRIKGARPTSPVVTITQEEMRLSGQNNLGEVIRALPQNFAGGQNPGVAIGAGGSIDNQNISGSSSLNLRGLGADATLTLLNGSRLPYDGFIQATDVSVIPVAAIERVEILLDGASAIYGSDAVGGVANLVLKRDYEGVELSARFGAATDGGYEQQQYTAVAGTNWGSGGFLVTGDYSDSTAIHSGQRDYLSLPPQHDILPESRQKGGLFSGHQEIGGIAEFSLDAFYSERGGSQFTDLSVFGFNILARRDTTIWGLAPALRFALPQEWSLRLHGFYGENEANLGQTLVSAPPPPIVTLFESVRCFCNQAQAAGVEVEGPVFALPGGDTRLSVGGGWRKNAFANNNLLTGVTGTNGEDSSYYAYGEVYLPLISEDQAIPFVTRLALSGAVRHEDYKSFGTTTVPKIGAVWGITPGLDLKASWGKSFKAPTLSTLFSRSLISFDTPGFLGGVGYPADFGVLFLQGGNPALTPERAEIITAGFAFDPEFLPGFHMEFGWFDIDYADRVSAPINPLFQALTNPIFIGSGVTFSPTLAEQTAAFALVGLPFGTFNDFSSVPYDPTKVIAIVDNRVVNIAEFKARGVDLSLRYTTELFTGNLTVSGNANWLDSTRRITPLAPETEAAGSVFFPAKFKARGGLSWARDGLTLVSIVNHTGGVKDTLVAPVVQGDGMTTLDLIIDYQIQSGLVGDMGFNLAVTNALNQKPPLFGGPPSPGVANFDSTNYSAIGRVVSATLTKRF